MIDIVEVLSPLACRPADGGGAAEPRGRTARPSASTSPRPRRPGSPRAARPLGRDGVGRAGPGLVPRARPTTRARSRTHGVIDAHSERIADMLKTNKATTVHQRLRDEHGLDVGISSFRRYVWLAFPDEALENKVTVLRPDVAAGEEAQIDYGYLGPLGRSGDQNVGAGCGPSSWCWP